MRHAPVLSLALVSLAGSASAQTRTPVPPVMQVPSGYSILGDSPVAPAGFTLNGRIVSAESPQVGPAHPVGLIQGAATTFGGKLYVMGGDENANSPSDHTWEFDPATSTWTMKANMPARDRGQAVTANGRIYFFASDVNPGKVFEYDPLTDSWSSKTPLSVGRSNFAAAVVNDRVYVFGGRLAAAYATDYVDEYDPVSDTWSSRARMPTARSYQSAAAIGGRILVIGGIDVAFSPIATCDEYDPSADRWRTRSSMAYRRMSAAAAEAGGKILCAGGLSSMTGPYQYQFVDAVEEYDPTADRWTIAAKAMTRVDAAAAALDGVVHVVGGQNSVTPYIDLHEELRPTRTLYVFKRN